ncbi:hypothetical protein ACNOYE_14285 [Nannocystaceae bacterium ST9]
MLDQRVRALAWAWTALLLAACAEPRWARQTWPSAAVGQLAQPRASVEALELELSARAITWEPDAIVVELVSTHAGARALTIDPSAVFLEYDGLEYAPARVEPSGVVVLAGETDEQVIELRYELGRPLTGAGARLRLRGMLDEREPVVDVPELPVPAMPAEARNR